MLVIFSDVQHKVQCSEDNMKIIVALSGNETHTYLDGLNGYRNEKCEPKLANNQAIFDLSLVNFYECGIMRVINKMTVSVEKKCEMFLQPEPNLTFSSLFVVAFV